METYAHYFEANKDLWNKKTPVHITSDFYNRDGFLAGKNVLTPIELSELGPVSGKSLLHLQCHFGMDTLCWARMGAWVTGVDFSETAIHEALLLAKQIETNARFVCCNVYDTRQHITDTFDIVFTSYGTIGWLPNLDKWAQAIAQSLTKGGHFYMADFHPVVWMMDEEFKYLKYPYYNHSVIETDSIGTYTNREADINGKEYGWNHSISEILNALINNGLELEFFNEHYYSPYNCFSNTVETAPGQWQIKGLEGIIPMVYSLKAIKK
jgi:2-polyprenyl-3-methyl-5-hydroxy-6-metoxy-1,4-benzoquinol methylase